mmetsp:Transcript_950/g.2345  ORF Transcript_950/g.2345 Transcript_950/m.2345 type:complete len:639 (+) Transcript_950:4384-6300(+)
MLHSHRLTPSQARNDRRQLLRTQYPIPILIQLVKAAESTVHKMVTVQQIREVSRQVPHHTIHCLPVSKQHVDGVADGSNTWVLDLLRLQPSRQDNKLGEPHKITDRKLLPIRIEHLNEPSAMIHCDIHWVLTGQLHHGRDQLICCQCSATISVQIVEHALALSQENVTGERAQQPIGNHVGMLLEHAQGFACICSELTQHLIYPVPRTVRLLFPPSGFLILEPGHCQAKLYHGHILLLRNDPILGSVKNTAELFAMIQRNAHGTTRPRELDNHRHQLLERQHTIPVVVQSLEPPVAILQEIRGRKSLPCPVRQMVLQAFQELVIASQSVEQLLDAKCLGIRGLLTFHVRHQENELHHLHKLLATHHAIAPGVELDHELLTNRWFNSKSIPLRHGRHGPRQLGCPNLASTLSINRVEGVHASIHKRLRCELGRKPIGDAGLTRGLCLMPHPRHHYHEPGQFNKLLTANAAVAISIKHPHHPPAMVFGDIQGSSLGQFHDQRHQFLHLQCATPILVHLIKLLQARSHKIRVATQLLHPDWQAMLKLAEDQSVLLNKRQHLRHALSLRHMHEQLGVAPASLLPQHHENKRCVGLEVLEPQGGCLPKVLGGQAQAIAESCLLTGRACNRNKPHHGLCCYSRF